MIFDFTVLKGMLFLVLTIGCLRGHKKRRLSRPLLIANQKIVLVYSTSIRGFQCFKRLRSGNVLQRSSLVTTIQNIDFSSLVIIIIIFQILPFGLF